MQTKLPIEYSYKITETFYAGEYPFSKEPQVGKPKLKRLIVPVNFPDIRFLCVNLGGFNGFPKFPL